VTDPVEPRRVPSTPGGAVYLVVVALSAVGLAIVAWGPWRRGVALIGVALLLGALVRVFLRENDAGMLRVRSRWFDVIALAGVGATLLVLASVIPNQPAP
jgi:peptidoglycan/LPS O-acetylase OafA/YrhL